jgi:hypothetical protein
MSSARFALLALLALGWNVLGCGSSSPEQPDAAVQQDATAQQDAAPSGAFTVVVYTAGFTGPFRGLLDHPFQGATVAAELPGGETREVTTGSDGKATFTGVDWSLGTAAVTAWAPGMRPWSYSGIGAQDTDLPTWLHPLAAPPKATVSGTAQNLPDVSQGELDVSASNGLSSSTTSTSSFSLDVQTGVDFSLLGVAWVSSSMTGRDWTVTVGGWARVDHAAITADATIDLDFATPVTAVGFSGTLVLPTKADDRFRTRSIGTGNVWTLESGGAFSLGGIFQSTVAGDGNSLGYAGEYVQFAGATIMTTYQLVVESSLQPDTWRGSSVIQRGYPEDGAQITGFLTEPLITTDVSNPVPLHSPIAWTMPDGATQAVLTVYKDGAPVWYVWSLPGAGTLTLPGLPTAVDANDLLGGGALKGRITAVADIDPTTNVWRRSAYGPKFDLSL